MPKILTPPSFVIVYMMTLQVPLVSTHFIFSCQLPNELWSPWTYFFNICWTKVHFVRPLITTVLDFVLLSPWVFKPECFLICTLTCLCVVNLSLLLLALTPIGVYTVCVQQTSLMQAAEGRQQCITNLGSSEI